MNPRDLVAALKALGMSQKAIGDVMGVNDSYISQVARGKKSGAAYQAALQQLHDTLSSATRQGAKPSRSELTGAVQRPERRKNRHGQAARVRGAKYYARGFTASVRTAAAQKGAPSLRRLLADAAEAGLNVAWTVTFRPPRKGEQPINRQGKSGKHGRRHGPGTKITGQTLKPGTESVEFQTIPAQHLLDQVMADHGGNLTAALCAVITARGLASGDVVPSRVLAIEMRAW